MDSAGQYQPIAMGEHGGRLAPSSSGGHSKLMYVLGAVLLVASTALVTAHVTGDHYNREALSAMRVARNPYGADSLGREANVMGRGGIVFDDNYLKVVRGVVDEICNRIKYTSCHYSSAQDTDWCKICAYY